MNQDQSVGKRTSRQEFNYTLDRMRDMVRTEITDWRN